MKFPIFPEQASRVAQETDYLYWSLTCLSGLMLLIIFTPMIYFLFKYRRGKPANRRPLRILLAICRTPLPSILRNLPPRATTHVAATQRAPVRNLHSCIRSTKLQNTHPNPNLGSTLETPPSVRKQPPALRPNRLCGAARFCVCQAAAHIKCPIRPANAAIQLSVKKRAAGRSSGNIARLIQPVRSKHRRRHTRPPQLQLR